MKKKQKFKDRYVLGEGFPWMYGTVENKQIGINEQAMSMRPLKMDWPEELWSRDLPKYKLILVRVK